LKSISVAARTLWALLVSVVLRGCGLPKEILL